MKNNITTTIAIVGLGNWGKNHLRTFDAIPWCQVKYIFDKDNKCLSEIGNRYARIRCATRFGDIIEDADIEGVVIATSSNSHYSLTRDSLVAGKDVLVEKPLAGTSREASELCELAQRNGCILMVGHLLLYHPALAKLIELIHEGLLGDIYYFYSQRTNLGIIRDDENCMYSLAAHDISAALHIFNGEMPRKVSAVGSCYVRKDIEDVVFLNCIYDNGSLANIHTSWLDPHKVRRITVVGSRKMAVFDDMETTEKLRIYDKGVDMDHGYNSFGEAMSLRFGDIYSPSINMREPLRLEAEHFLDCIVNRKQPLTPGQEGLKVVQILEQAQQSLKAKR